MRIGIYLKISIVLCLTWKYLSLSLTDANGFYADIDTNVDIVIVIITHIVIGIVQLLLIVWIEKIDTDGVGFDGRVNADGILKNGPDSPPINLPQHCFTFSLTCENCCLGLFVCLFVFCILKHKIPTDQFAPESFKTTICLCTLLGCLYRIWSINKKR